MSNALERIRKNKNTPPQHNGERLISGYSEVAIESENGSVNTNVNKNNNTIVLASYNKSEIETDDTSAINGHNTSETISENNDKTTIENVNTIDADNENVDEYENISVNAYVLANKKPKFEETHRKCTFWLEDDLYDRLHNLTSGEKGLKTQVVNDALKQFLKKIKA